MSIVDFNAKTYTLTFTPHDTSSTGAGELAYQVRTAASGGGTLLTSGTATSGSAKTTSTITDSALALGDNTRYIRVTDGAGNVSETAATVTAQYVFVELDIEFEWAIAVGVVELDITFQWSVPASPASIDDTLRGRFGPVVIDFRFERRTLGNQFLEDVTPAFIAATISGDNDRAVFRTATFTIDPSLATVDPLSDHIAVIADLLINDTGAGTQIVPIQAGLFALNAPTKTFQANGSEQWAVQASDLCVHLVEATTTSSYTVASGTNFLTACKTILDNLSLPNALGANAQTLAVAQTWPAGTPWLTIVNKLLSDINYYSCKFDHNGVARSRPIDNTLSRPADVAYSDVHWLTGDIGEQTDTTRFANQIIATATDPARAPLSSVATNADPDSPISTVNLGRTISKVVTADGTPDQTTLDAIATAALQDAANAYRTMDMITQLDPRREPFEMYEITDAQAGYSAEKWLARKWSYTVDGATMQHTVSNVSKMVAA